MSKMVLKAALFVVWPFMAVIFLLFVALFFLLVWPLIPFCRVIEKDGKTLLDFGA